MTKMIRKNDQFDQSEQVCLGMSKKKARSFESQIIEYVSFFTLTFKACKASTKKESETITLRFNINKIKGYLIKIKNRKLAMIEEMCVKLLCQQKKISI